MPYPPPPPLLLLLHASIGTAIVAAKSPANIPFMIFIRVSSRGLASREACQARGYLSVRALRKMRLRERARSLTLIVRALSRGARDATRATRAARQMSENDAPI